MRNWFLAIIFSLSLIDAGEFTICSYNCGGLTEHYDYLRAAAMEKLIQERHMAEPEAMAQIEKMQKLALKILFSNDPINKENLVRRWEKKGYGEKLKKLTASPAADESINASWYEKCNAMISSYKMRPVVISDKEVEEFLEAHLLQMAGSCSQDRSELLALARKMMAIKIFNYHLQCDIICLQEADYLDSSLFPSKYKVLFSDTAHSKNGVAWNKDRFELKNVIGNVLGRAFILVLEDRETGKSLLVVSGHITGCNPFIAQEDIYTGFKDSDKGDDEIRTIVRIADEYQADLSIIGMDSNVAATHPRLKILKDADYQLDQENFLEPSCSNPNLILNTRIDWILVKSKEKTSITNIPILSVGLNSIKTNISDHKPVAAKIVY